MTDDGAARLRAGLAERYLAAWQLAPDGRFRDDDGALALPVRPRADRKSVV